MQFYFKEKFQQSLNLLSRNQSYRFWLFQIVGWIGLCVVTFLSLTLWYNAPEWSYVAHTIVQAMLGMALTIPVRMIYRAIWEKRSLYRLSVSIIVVIVGALLWTLVRMIAYQFIVTEEHLWVDFGGWYFGSFMVFASWSSIYYGVKYYQLLNEEHLKRLTAEAHSKEAQLKMLRYQINPHFLFNTLNSVSALIKTERSEQARQMVSQLSVFLRYSLDTDPALRVSLDRELEMLMQYLNVEKARYGERLKLEYIVDDHAKMGLLPSMLLQPLYENALKYALINKKENGILSLKISLVDAKMQILLSDNGPGMSPDMLAAFNDGHSVGRGLGLRNTYERLLSQYDENFSFTLSLQEPSGLVVKIEIPFETEEIGTKKRSH